MCFPSCKSLLICGSFAGLIVLILVTAGPGALVVPAELIKEHLPTPHIALTFARGKGSPEGTAYNLEEPFMTAGYRVERGKLAPLALGTCEQCMGSPASVNPHLAVLFEGREGATPECFYNNTNLSPALHLNSDEALIIVTDGPTPDTFEEFSWGTYIFDTWDTKGRALIQAGMGNPLRPKKNVRMMLVFTFMPEIAEMLSENLRLPDVDSSGVHWISLSTKLIQTDLAPLYNDRLAILLKTIIRDNARAQKFYGSLIANTEILRFRVQDPETRALVRRGATHETNAHTRLGVVHGKEQTELQSLAATVDKVVASVKSKRRVITATAMLPLREVLNVKGPRDCIENRINCLAEDWDVTYSVSGGLLFPDTTRYSAAIVGVDHPEGRRTTLSLYNVNTNQELATLPLEDDLVYVQWISRDCKKEPKPCTQINSTEEFFIRERSYGMEAYENIVPPKVLLIKY